MPKSKKRRRRVAQAQKQLDQAKRKLEKESSKENMTSSSSLTDSGDHLDCDTNEGPQATFINQIVPVGRNEEKSERPGWLGSAWDGICNSVVQVSATKTICLTT